MRIEHKIFVVVAIFLLTIGIATAIPIDLKEKLGPYGKDHKYYIRVYNVDDVAKAEVNGKLVVQKTYGQDSGWLEITNDMKKGKNTIEFTLENGILGGWTYGFEIRQDSSKIIFSDECGIVGVKGCMEEDSTQGLVYRNVISIIGPGIH